MEALETHYVEEETVACDGGPNPALGHPRVFLSMEEHGQVDCPYCGRRYILKEGTKVGHGH